MKRRELKLTDAQHAALDELLAKTGETFAAFVRRHAEQDAAQYGINFPQDMPVKPSLDDVRGKRWSKPK